MKYTCTIIRKFRTLYDIIKLNNNVTEKILFRLQVGLKNHRSSFKIAHLETGLFKKGMCWNNIKIFI